MGYIISGIIIDQLPDLNHLVSIGTVMTDSKFSHAQNTSLCSSKLTIGFKNGSTFIFLDNICFENMTEEESLSKLESDINNIFPNSRFIVIMVNEVSDVYGYSYINRGVKLRTKCVVQGDQFLDYGELNPLEEKLLVDITEYLNEKPETRMKLDEHSKSMTALQTKKFYLIFRDKLFKRNDLKNSQEYLQGSLDFLIINSLFSSMLKSDFQQIENSEALVFDKKKLDFEKESLASYVLSAYKANS